MNQSVFSIDSLLFLCPSVVAASVPSSSCWIFYRVWKAIQWNHRREGEDVAGVLPPLTSPHLRDALQHLSAGQARPLFKSRSCPFQRPNDAYCLSESTYSKQGGGAVINESWLSGPAVPSTAAFSGRRNRREVKSARFHLEAVQMWGEETTKEQGWSWAASPPLNQRGWERFIRTSMINGSYKMNNLTLKNGFLMCSICAFSPHKYK